MKVTDHIQYGSTKINYLLEFVERKTLGIKVHPDKSVKVLAPKEVTIEKVREKVKIKASWILKQQDFFLSFHPLTPARKFVSGETHLYLGKQYRIKLHEANKNLVKLLGGYIHIYTKDTQNKARIEKELKEWYRNKAKIHFDALFKEHLPLATKLYEYTPTLQYRWMKKRWGSCDNKGGIHLNLELIKAPKKCIEYVIVHEICHLSHLNHSKAFFDLLESEYPDWKKTKDRLERLMV